MATVLSGGPDAVATGSTALALHRVRGLRLLPIQVVVARRPPRWALAGVEETLRLPERHRSVVQDIPTATVARALFDLGARVRLDRLRRATDAALAARLVAFEELESVIEDLAEHGRHGSAPLRQVVSERSITYRPPATELESAFLDLIREGQLPEPDRQVDLGDRLRWVGQVDFLWRDQRVIVETDGRAFHDSMTDRVDDERRDRALASAGWSVLRFSYLDVTTRPSSVRRTLSHALRHA